MLKFENVSFCYKSEPVFQNFSLSVNEGEATGVLGHSGCGKTTFMQLASGIIKPTSGKIVLFNANRPSFIFQEDRLLPWLSAAENLAFVGADADCISICLGKTGLSESADKFPNELSGGMSRRLSIARTLAFGGDCFFIDEPLHGLDIKTSAQILELIHSEISGKTALIITHSLEEAFVLCDRVLIAGGTPFHITADLRMADFKNLDDFKLTAEKLL